MRESGEYSGNIGIDVIRIYEASVRARIFEERLLQLVLLSPKEICLPYTLQSDLSVCSPWPVF
jgi:hypothetical protein